MKALVLTYDNNRSLTDHMIYKYDQLWPDNPFVFRIPYQELAGQGEADREYIRSPADIKSTLLSLVAGINDEEWVYWCIDDKYPIDLNLPALRSIIAWIRTVDDTAFSGVLFCRPPKLLKQKFTTGDKIRAADGSLYLERNSYKRIWIHQFLRVKVLKHLFESFPDEITSAKTMDLLKTRVSKPADHRLFLSTRNLAVLGESTTRGKLTDNCHESISKTGLELPDWYTGKLAEGTIHGKMPGQRIRALRERLFSQGLVNRGKAFS